MTKYHIKAKVKVPKLGLMEKALEKKKSPFKNQAEEDHEVHAMRKEEASRKKY